MLSYGYVMCIPLGWKFRGREKKGGTEEEEEEEKTFSNRQMAATSNSNHTMVISPPEWVGEHGMVPWWM